MIITRGLLISGKTRVEVIPFGTDTLHVARGYLEIFVLLSEMVPELRVMRTEGSTLVQTASSATHIGSGADA